MEILHWVRYLKYLKQCHCYTITQWTHILSSEFQDPLQILKSFLYVELSLMSSLETIVRLSITVNRYLRWQFKKGGVVWVTVSRLHSMAGWCFVFWAVVRQSILVHDHKGTEWPRSRNRREIIYSLQGHISRDHSLQPGSQFHH